MSICPKCKREIDCLHNIQSGTAGWEMRIDKDGNEEYEQMDEFFVPSGCTNVWRCPECDKTVFSTEEKAVEFLLKGRENVNKKTKDSY